MIKMITQIMKNRLRRLEETMTQIHTKEIAQIRENTTIAQIRHPRNHFHNLRNPSQRGQSIAEYLVVAAAILAAVVAIKGPVQAAWFNIINNAINKIGP